MTARTTNEVGGLTQAKVLARLVELGKHVLVPYCNIGRYDLLIDNRDGTYTRVECKTGRYRRGCIEFNSASTGGYGGSANTKHYNGDADLFAIWYPGTDNVYAMPVNECTKTKGLLRLDPPKGPGGKIVRWASDYKL